MLTGIRAAFSDQPPRDFLTAIAEDMAEAEAAAERWAAEQKADEQRRRQQEIDAELMGVS